MKHIVHILIAFVVWNTGYSDSEFSYNSSFNYADKHKPLFTKPEALSFLTVTGSIQGTISSEKSFSLVSWIKQCINKPTKKTKIKTLSVPTNITIS
jgi:hypothetical protein